LAVRGFRVVVAIQLLLLAPPAVALDLTQQPFTVRTLRQADAVHAVTQTPDGMIWFGSRVGVTRYDGEQFLPVPLGPDAPEGGHPKVWVRRMRAARDGSLWVATGSGELELAARPGSVPRVFAPHGAEPRLVQLWPYRPVNARDRSRVLTASDGLPDPWVWAMVEDDEGGMWVGTEGGLVRFAGGRAQRFSTGDGLPSNFVTALAFQGGRLFVGTSAGVVVRRDGRFQALPIREPVMALAADRAARVWAAAQGRLLRLDPDGRLQSFVVNRPVALTVDAQDNLWVGGYVENGKQQEGESLTVFVRGQPQALSTRMAPHQLATDVLVDREGSVWVSLREGGVTQLSTPAVRNLGLEEGLSGRIAYSVLHARDGSSYVATNGGISRWLEGQWATWADGDALGSGPRDIAEGVPGTATAGIWFAMEGHLLRGGAAGWRRYPLDRPPFNAGVGGSRTIVIADGGDVFLSRRHPLALLRLPGGDLARARVEISAEGGLCPGVLAHGLQAADSALWFVGDYGPHGAGVTRVAQGRARCFGTADGLPDVQIGAITEDRERNIWLGTGWGAGLIRYRQGRFSTIPASVGLPASSITGLLDDGRGFLWLCSESGVWRIAKAELHRCADQRCSRLPAAVFTKAQGMRTAECVGVFHPNMSLDRQGNVWVATLGGVTVFSPPERTQRTLFSPTVEEIAVDGVPVAVGPTISIGAGQRSLVVRYTVASFVGPSRPRLRHRLVGFDADWVPVAGAGVAHYHDLAAGQYTLELAAGDQPAQVTRLSVVARPPLWRTPAFFALVVLLTAVIAVALHRARVSRIGLRHRVANDERVRIARELHDGLAQKLRAIGLLSDRLRQDGAGEADKLKKMRLIIGEAHAELRRAIWDMREGAETQRVEMLIEQLLSQLVIPTGINVNLQTAGNSLPVPSMVAQEVRLVAKEALVNALTHSLAKHIEIGVLSDEEGLHVWVRDDGRGGLQPEHEAARNGHYGLLGMLERTRRLGGRLSTRSEPGLGTEVSLFVPRAEMQPGGGQ
jgi:signal transduction histidine kinase/ligand-binding sensor domain-containing protein